MQSPGNDVHIILTDFEVPTKYKTRLENPQWNHKVINLKRVNLQDIDLEKVDIIVVVGDVLGDPLGFRPSEATRNLKLFQTLTAGVDQLDLSVIPEGAVICSNAGAYAEPMAEFVFAFILALAKNLPSLQEEMRQGNFPRQSAQATFLKGKTIGIIGAGGIGRATAKIAKAFGMRAFGIAARPRSIDNFDFVGTLDDLDYLLRESDFIVISIPLTPRTRALINRERLNMMKRGSVLINVARGPIIVEKDLYDHLKENPEFKAGIDVWWRYPSKGEKFKPDYPFDSLKNVLLTPHISWKVPEADDKSLGDALENVVRFLAGQELRGTVNRSDYGY